MKGMWNSEKSVNTTYLPALGALSAVDASLFAIALQAVLADGGALMFSRTRDGGAICLYLMQGDSRIKVYASDAQELGQALQDLIDSLSSPPDTAPKNTRKR